jgi:hypothetical protein
LLNVTADMFSGLPNPKWALTPAQGSEFLRRFKNLPPGSKVTAIPDLGYRGLLVDSTDSSFGPQTRIYNGSVHQGGQIFRDAHRELERWLADTTPDKALRDTLRKELA